MVKTCSWGMCNSDTRYPERLYGGVEFFCFPRWKYIPSNREKCLRWIRACNRPYDKLNIFLVENSYRYYICGKHFIGGKPSYENPDPLTAPDLCTTRKRQVKTPKQLRAKLTRTGGSQVVKENVGRQKERKSSRWNAVPMLFNVPISSPKKYEISGKQPGGNKEDVESNVISCSDERCPSCSLTESLPIVGDLPSFLQEHNYAQFFLIVAFIERSSGKLLYHLRRNFPCELLPRNSIVTPHAHSRKFDRNKQIENETNGGYQTRSKSQKNGKRKLTSKVISKRKRQTKKTCINEHSDTEQEFIVKIERDEDCEYEESDVNSFRASETASETETVLEKQVDIEPNGIPDNTFETCSNFEESHGYLAYSGKTIKLEPHNDYIEWPVVTCFPETRENTETVVKTEPYNDTGDSSPGLFETSNMANNTGTVAEKEVKTEPCSDIEERPPVSWVTSNIAHSAYMADSNMMSEHIRTMVKREIVNDSDDSEQPTTVYVCELCNKCFYSHHQLLKHAENHEKN